MPLATKNGSLIVKDGKVAENCGCCLQANCEPGTPLAPGAQSLSITVTLDNIQPTAGGLQQLRPIGKWLEFLGPSVSTGVYTNFDAFNNNAYGIDHDTIKTITYLGSRVRESRPPAFAYLSPNACFYRYGDTTSTGGTQQVRDTASSAGWYVPAMGATWQLQDGVYVYVSGVVTGVLNFVPPGALSDTPLPRLVWRDHNGISQIMTAGGFFFEAGFALTSLVDTRTFTAKTASNIFSSASAGTTYTWQYDITVSMQ